MEDNNTCKIISGPGLDRWPGTPHKNVDNAETQVAAHLPQAEPAKDTTKDDKLRHAMRLKLMSAVHIAAKRFPEDDVRAIVEQALANARTHNDYS